MNPLLGLGIAQGVGTLFSGITGRKNLKRQIEAQRENAQIAANTALKQTEMTNAAQMELAQYQNDYNTQMWEKQNAYNTPTSQMSRLKEAGLNPALMYSQGSTGQASAPAEAASYHPDYSRYVTSAQKVAQQSYDWGQAISNVVGMAMQLQQLKGVGLENEARSIQNSFMEDRLRAENQLKFQKFYWNGEIPSASMSRGIANALYNKVLAQSDYAKANVGYLGQRSDLMREMIKATRGRIDLVASQKNAIDTALWEYNKTTRPWVENLGMGYKPVSSIGGILEQLLGAFAKSFGAVKGFGLAK